MGRDEVGNGKHTAASRSAGFFAHCVYPIVLSNPFTSTKNRPWTFLVVSHRHRTACAAHKGRKKTEEWRRGNEDGTSTHISP